MIWIGVDAHKRVHQGVALGLTGVVAQKQITNTAAGWADLRAWAGAWPDRVWAIEGSASYGRGLAQFLAERGERVHEVSPKWRPSGDGRCAGPARVIAWTRMPSLGCCGRKRTHCRWSCLKIPRSRRSNFGAGCGMTSWST